MNPVESASFLSKLTFNWLNPLFAASHAGKINLPLLGKIESTDSVKHQLDELENAVNYYSKQGSEVAILKAIMMTSKSDFAKLLGLNVAWLTFELLKELSRNRLINYIESPLYDFEWT